MTSPSAEPVRSYETIVLSRRTLFARSADSAYRADQFSHMILNYLAEKVLELPKSY